MFALALYAALRRSGSQALATSTTMQPTTETKTVAGSTPSGFVGNGSPRVAQLNSGATTGALASYDPSGQGLASFDTSAGVTSYDPAAASDTGTFYGSLFGSTTY